MRDDRLLTPGQTCWRIARADQFACIIDAADYFTHVKAAMLRARHRIMLVSWDLDARMTFERGAKTLPIVPEGHRGTSRTGQDVAAIYRADRVR